MEHPAHYDDLEAIHDATWDLLVRGVRDRSLLAHTPVLATVDTKARPQARSVVLRGCTPETRTLHVHTDRRSAKASEIEAQPRGAVHVYEPGEKIQLRLDVALSLATSGPLVEARWEASHAGSRACYAVAPGPGTPLDDPRQASFEGDGRAHFAVITARVEALEWLFLSAHGHRRARFTYGAAGRTQTWLTP